MPHPPGRCCPRVGAIGPNPQHPHPPAPCQLTAPPVCLCSYSLCVFQVGEQAPGAVCRPAASQGPTPGARNTSKRQADAGLQGVTRPSVAGATRGCGEHQVHWGERWRMAWSGVSAIHASKQSQPAVMPQPDVSARGACSQLLPAFLRRSVRRNTAAHARWAALGTAKVGRAVVVPDVATADDRAPVVPAVGRVGRLASLPAGAEETRHSTSLCSTAAAGSRAAAVAGAPRPAAAAWDCK